MRKLVEALSALLGLAVLAGALNLMFYPFSAFYMGFSFWQAVGAFALSLLPAAVSVALGVYLIRDRKRVAAWYVPSDDDAPVVATESLLRVGLVLLGIYLVVQAGPALLALMTSPLVNWLQNKVNTIYGDSGFADQETWQWVVQSIPKAVSTVTSLALGVLLVAKRERIIHRILGGGPISAEVTESTKPSCPHCGSTYDPADYDGGVAPPLCTDCKQPLDISHT